MRINMNIIYKYQSYKVNGFLIVMSTLVSTDHTATKPQNSPPFVSTANDPAGLVTHHPGEPWIFWGLTLRFGCVFWVVKNVVWIC